MGVININNITKDYGNQKGVFDLSFEVHEGEVMGFLGPNGAGKTTTIRQLLGFTKPDKGSVTILDNDCFNQAAKIQKVLGYLPGEIAFMDSMSGKEFIRFIADMKGMKDMKRANELMERFELDPSGRIKKMSKGMKQKIGIVCAFMQDPKILILDEPTSGLDPLMQNRFVELILEEKKRGKTILMSSHIFEEVERTCDRAAIIRQGRLVAVDDMEKLCQSKKKKMEITFADAEMAKSYAAAFPKAAVQGSRVMMSVGSNVDMAVKEAARYTVRDISMNTQSLEEFFMHFYEAENHTLSSHSATQNKEVNTSAHMSSHSAAQNKEV